MITQVTIPVKGSAPEIADWLNENVGTVTFRAPRSLKLLDNGDFPPDAPQWWSEGHGWRFSWMDTDYLTWTIEFERERDATAFMLRWL